MKETLKRAIDTFGEEAQMIVAVEELSELAKEITKHLRGKGDIYNMCEEIADVEIMVEQLKLMLPGMVEQMVAHIKAKKLKRLEMLIDEHIADELNAPNDRS